MNPLAQVIVAAVSTGLPTLTVLVSLLVNNQGLSDFEKRMDQRFREVDRRLMNSAIYFALTCTGLSKLWTLV